MSVNFKNLNSSYERCSCSYSGGNNESSDDSSLSPYLAFVLGCVYFVQVGIEVGKKLQGLHVLKHIKHRQRKLC